MQNSSRPKALISIDWFLPGTKSGGPVRSVANMIDQLENIDFYVVTRNNDYCSTEPYTTVLSNSWVQHSEDTQVYYISDDQLNKATLKRLIREVNPDVIYINGMYSTPFSIWPLSVANQLQLKTIVASRGMLSPHALAVKPLKKKIFLGLMNLKNAYKQVTFHATQLDEAKHIQKNIRNYKAIEVIPNLPRSVNHAAQTTITKNKGQLKLIYLGRVAKEKGTLIALKALQQCKGQVELDLFGTIYDEVYWEKCKAAIKTLPPKISVNYRGDLDSEKVIDTIKKHHFLLLFSAGENYGHANVESFLSGRPVIISKNTPWKALEKEKAGFDVTEPTLSTALQKAIDMNQSEFNEWSKSAHQKGIYIANDATLMKKYKELLTKK